MNKHYLTQLLSSILLLCASFTFATAQNLEVIGQLSYTQELSDIWGYYDSSTGIEYAIVGVYNGTSIVSLEDPTQPEELFFINGAQTIWRDMKVYDHYAYVINEGDDGMLVIDLAGLSENPPSIETYDWTGGNFEGQNVQFSTAHDVFIDEKNYLYILGANFGVGGAIILDLNVNPINPPIVGVYNERYVHDAFVRDDMLWTAEVNDGIMSAVDVSDKSNPTVLGTVATPDDFTHNCWLSDDSQYMFTTDEVSGGYLGSFNVSDVTDMKELDRIQSNPGSGVIPHNTFVVGNFLITSYYADGVTMHDISNPNAMVQVGQYDTSPNYDGNGFNGCWGVFPYTHSGLIFASDIEEGLYIISPTYKNAAFLDGTITDADTGSGLAGVTVSIEGTTVSATTGFGGNYIAGIGEAGIYDVTFELWGYESQTITVDLNNSETVFENISLQALPSFAIAGSILDATTGLPINNAQVTISHPQVTYNLATDVNGTFTVNNFWEADYTISVGGGWGYMPTIIETQTLSANDNYVSLYLDKGYYDDFSNDYGWTVSGNAGAGVWELGEPIGTEYFVGNINPEYDVSTDIGDQCFVTGNGGGGAGDDDVDDGVTILTSPVFDLTTYQSAHIHYYRWFVNEGGQGSSPNDDFTIKITNGDETVTVETITNSQSIWVQHDFLVSDFITPTANMQMIFEAADNPEGHLVEAGIDVFQVLDDMVGIETQDEQAMQVSIYPNPFVSELQVTLDKLPTDNYRFQLFDMYGRMIFEKATTTNELTVKRQNWPTGMYYYSIVNDETEALATGKVFLK